MGASVAPRIKRPFATLPDGWDDTWKAAKAACATTPAWLAVVGDSVSQGQGATAQETNGYVALLRAALLARGYPLYGDFYDVVHSVAAAPNYLGTPPWVLNTGGAVGTRTVLNNHAYMGGAYWQTWTSGAMAIFTAPYACTALDVRHTAWFAASGTTWTFTVSNAGAGASAAVSPALSGYSVATSYNGGTDTLTVTVTNPAANAANPNLRVALTGLSNAVHVVTLTGQSADVAASLNGVSLYAGSVGLGFVNASQQGTHSSVLLHSGQPTNRLKVWQGYGTAAQSDATQGFPSRPSLLIFAMGLNDCGNADGPELTQWTIARIARAVRRGRARCSVLVLALRNPDGVWDDGAGGTWLANATEWPVYMRALAEAARANNAAFLNIEARWGPNSIAAGFHTTNVHPTDAGHADIAAALGEVL